MIFATYLGLLVNYAHQRVSDAVYSRFDNAINSAGPLLIFTAR